MQARDPSPSDTNTRPITKRYKHATRHQTIQTRDPSPNDTSTRPITKRYKHATYHQTIQTRDLSPSDTNTRPVTKRHKHATYHQAIQARDLSPSDTNTRPVTIASTSYSPLRRSRQTSIHQARPEGLIKRHTPTPCEGAGPLPLIGGGLTYSPTGRC
jgi:hypothetical protein